MVIGRTITQEPFIATEGRGIRLLVSRDVH